MLLEKITIKGASIQDFAATRNEALSKSKADWILFVDADEVVSRVLEDEIRVAIKSNVFDAYYLKRDDTFLGRQLKHGETGNAKFIRLARRTFGEWQRPVHEVWEGKGKVGELTTPLKHTPHSSIASFLDKINRYSSMDAAHRYGEGSKSSLFKIAVYPIAKFKYNYMWRLGFLDGTPGLIMALMMSFHSYLTWTKLYLLWHKK